MSISLEGIILDSARGGSFQSRDYSLAMIEQVAIEASRIGDSNMSCLDGGCTINLSPESELSSIDTKVANHISIYSDSAG